MLLKFSVSNFLSYKGKQTFSMIAGKIKKDSYRLYKDKNIKVMKCNAIYGNNGAGKSNLLTAIMFMKQCVISGIPGDCKKYKCILSKDSDLAFFELQFLTKKDIYTYAFTISLDQGEVNEEYLYKNYYVGSEDIVFYRNLTQKRFIVGNGLKGRKCRLELEAIGNQTLEENNKLLINTLHNETNVKSEIGIFNNEKGAGIFKTLFNLFSKHIYVAKNDIHSLISNSSNPENIHFHYNVNLNFVSNLLQHLDLGIQKVVIAPLDLESDTDFKIFSSKIFSKASKHIDNRKYDNFVFIYNQQLYFCTYSKDSTHITYKIQFEHITEIDNRKFLFDFNDESYGIQKVILLSIFLFEESGKNIYFIDEFDNGLFPEISNTIISLYLKASEYRDTQLIMITHDAYLINSGLLRNDEITFIVKGKKGASKIKNIDDFNLRSNKNLLYLLSKKSNDDIEVDEIRSDIRDDWFYKC